MAKKIELGLELKGKDAAVFCDNQLRPSYTKKGEEMLSRAYQLSLSREKSGKRQ